MNYNYENISYTPDVKLFPYGVKRIITFSRKDLAYIEISTGDISTTEIQEIRTYVKFKLHNNNDSFLAWFETNEQAKEALKLVNRDTGNKLAIIKKYDDNRLYRDYITEVGSELYYNAIDELKYK